MKTVSLKMEDGLLRDIDKNLARNRYSTRTEFIREAVRDKLTEADKEEMLRALATYPKRKNSGIDDKKLHEIGEKVFRELERRPRSRKLKLIDKVFSSL